MAKDMLYKNCPLLLVATQNPNILNRKLNLLELDESVRQYQASSEFQRHELRAEIFFKLNPFLLKSLSRYCHVTTGCRINCKVGDLLSSAYVVFTQLIEKFTFKCNLNFLGYIVQGLSWGIFNSYMKEKRFNKKHILLSADYPDDYMRAVERKDIEQEWLSSIEMEELMSRLKSTSRDLFLLHYFFGYTYVDLATLKNGNVKTIQKVVERARKKMREELALQ